MSLLAAHHLNTYHSLLCLVSIVKSSVLFFNTVLKGMKLLELDALGGAGSRGCGQIRFIDVSIDNEKQDENFLDSIIMD